MASTCSIQFLAVSGNDKLHRLVCWKMPKGYTCEGLTLPLEDRQALTIFGNFLGQKTVRTTIPVSQKQTLAP